MGFEPTRAEPIGLAVQRLNHSATSSSHPCWLAQQGATEIGWITPKKGFPQPDILAVRPRGTAVFARDRTGDLLCVRQM